MKLYVWNDVLIHGEHHRIETFATTKSRAVQNVAGQINDPQIKAEVLEQIKAANPAEFIEGTWILTSNNNNLVV